LQCLLKIAQVQIPRAQFFFLRLQFGDFSFNLVIAKNLPAKCHAKQGKDHHNQPEQEPGMQSATQKRSSGHDGGFWKQEIFIIPHACVFEAHDVPRLSHPTECISPAPLP